MLRSSCRAAIAVFAGCMICLASAAGQDVKSPASAPAIPAGQKWVFAMGNLATDKGKTSLMELARRASKAGYNGFMLGDIKIDKFQLQTEAYIANLKEFRDLCTELKLKFIPCVTPFGYSYVFLSNDPNLAEGMPVRNATFVVKDGLLVPFDDTTKLVNGSLEEWKDNVPVGWQVDEPGKMSFRDDSVAADGKASLRQEDVLKNDKHAHGRLWQKIKVKPWHYYHISAMVKTENCTNKDYRIFGLQGGDVGGMPLNWQAPEIAKTQDWKHYDATFCSLENTEVTLYLGCWNGKAGKIWWDDVKIEPGGFVNVIRRDSTPLTVTSLDGKTTYAEGKDFAKVADPKLAFDPNPGYFTNWHQAPEVKIPSESKLKDGDKVLVSYNFASTCGKPNNINMCMSEPKTYDVVEKQIRWVKENAQPDIYLLSHDEIRMNGWDDTCAKTGKNSGQILADNIRKCVEIVKKVDPGKPVMVWNDMFDPFHNAKDKEADGSPFVMYMTKGNWSGSWEGLTTDVAVGTWLQQSVPSVEFWSKRGHQVLLMGYYDADPANIVEWLKTTSHCKNVVGVMYTTWVGDYSKLEEFIELVKKCEASKKQ